MRMRLISLFGAATIGLAGSRGVACKLDDGVQMPLQPFVDSGDLNWDVEPNADATGHHIFNSVSSLLQLWPNTVVRPGHTIAPCIIPVGTTLYHGKIGPDIPAYPDWLAFDATHGYLFARWRNGHLLTFSTTRELRMLYFDGASGVKIDDGSNDTQELLMFGDVRGRHSDGSWEDEEERIETLCKWAMRHGLDGFVRMEIDFEIMQCNLTDGLKLVSSLEVLPYADNFNISKPTRTEDPDLPHRGPGSPGWGEPPVRPSGWRGSLPTNTSMEIRSGSRRHDHAPGETRVRILYDKLITFYDPALTSLLAWRRGKPREKHRLKGISKEDAALKLLKLEEVVKNWDRKGSGIDWGSAMQVIVDRYAQRLEVLAETLTNTSYPDVRTRAAKARAQVLTMLAPHFTQSDVPRAGDAIVNKAWLAPAVQRCATASTAGLSTSLLTPQEHLLLRAIDEVTREICRRLGRMLHGAFDVEDLSWKQERVEDVVAFMHAEVAALMGWLDWTSAWVKCKPACTSEEMCVVPTWPYELGKVLNNTRQPWCMHLPNV